MCVCVCVYEGSLPSMLGLPSELAAQTQWRHRSVLAALFLGLCLGPHLPPHVAEAEILICTKGLRGVCFLGQGNPFRAASVLQNLQTSPWARAVPCCSAGRFAPPG